MTLTGSWEIPVDGTTNQWRIRMASRLQALFQCVAKLTVQLRARFGASRECADQWHIYIDNVHRDA